MSPRPTHVFRRRGAGPRWRGPPWRVLAGVALAGVAVVCLLVPSVGAALADVGSKLALLVGLILLAKLIALR